MGKPSILVTCAGRRVELVHAFQAALSRMGGGRVVAADCNPTAPTLSVADGIVFLPTLNDECAYVAALKAAIREHEAMLVVPTIDTELPLLARHRSELESQTGTRVLVSPVDCIDICADKAKTACFFEEHGVAHASTWRGRGEVEETGPDFPLIVKPARGSSSQNVFVARNRRELDFFLDYVNDPVIQKLLVGQEYTIDGLLDFDSQFVAAVARKRLAVRAGEILKGQIDCNAKVIDASHRALEALGTLGAIGPITLQGFLCSDGEFRFTEINPRFGGGAPMSFAAGADYADWLSRVAAGLPQPLFNTIRNGAVFSRFDSTVEIQQSLVR